MLLGTEIGNPNLEPRSNEKFYVSVTVLGSQPNPV